MKFEFDTLFADDRAVSPVIGVILMVAITVILAAVIGTFVLGIAPDDEPAPTVQLELSEGTDDNLVTVRHRGGQALDTDDLTLVINGSVAQNAVWEDTGTFGAGESFAINTSGDAGPGDEITLSIRHDPSDSVLRTADVTVGSA